MEVDESEPEVVEVFLGAADGFWDRIDGRGARIPFDGRGARTPVDGRDARFPGDATEEGDEMREEGGVSSSKAVGSGGRGGEFQKLDTLIVVFVILVEPF